MAIHRYTALFLFVVLAAPVAFAGWEHPPDDFLDERFVVYWSGTCNGGSKTYNGNYEWSCDDYNYYQGTRSGKWRHIQDTHCVYPESVTFNRYEVCTSGSSCTDSSGTWQEITQTQFNANYCP